MRHTKTFMTITFEIGIRILCQNTKENIDFIETKGTFSLSVIFERPF